MAKSDELVKYISQRVATYIDTPKEVRKQRRQTAPAKESWAFRWFGMVPFSIRMWIGQMRKK